MATFNAGYSTRGSLLGGFSGLTGIKFTLTQSGVLQSLNIYFNFAAGAHVNMGLYSDSGGNPNALLATCAPQVLAAGTGALNTLTTTTHPTLPPGDYWVAENTDISVNGYYENAGSATTGAFNNGVAWNSGVLPSTWPASGSGPYQFSLYATFDTVVSALSFPMAIADTSSVVALGFSIQKHFPVAIADTSTVVKLGFGIGSHFPVAIADTSTVVALGFHIVAALSFPLHIADSSSVLALGFNVTRRFALNIADTSTVLALGFGRVRSGFGLQIADTSSVQLGYTIFVPTFPVTIRDTTTVWIAFGNDHHLPPREPLIVPPYAGQSQPTQIIVSRSTQYREQMEEGPWVMPPYASIYPPPTQGPGEAWVPPPVKQIDIFTAQQTWPL